MRCCYPAVLITVLAAGCSGKEETYRAPQDEDGDGYTDDRDCDDADATISPAAEEICDTLDNDCDGLADQNAVDATTWYPDNDGDGYGNSAVPGHVSCDDPSDADTTYSAEGEDCDDGAAETNPGAVDICADDLDNDCNGTTDDCSDPGSVNLAASDAKLVGGVAGGNAGGAVAGLGDMDGDGLAEIGVGAPSDSTAGTQAGAAFVVSGSTRGESALSGAYTLMGENAGDLAGTAITGAGDVNGDGYSDLVVGAPKNDGAFTDGGTAYVVLGPVTSSISLALADSLLRGNSGNDRVGSAVAGVGDVDGDGMGDLLVGAPLYHGADPTGMAYLVLGVPSGESSIKPLGARLSGAAASDMAGNAVGGPGDVDGDGLADLLVGATNATGGGVGCGSVWLVLDDVRDAVSLVDSAATLNGEVDGDGAGVSVAGAGDVDGDGTPDLIVGANGQDGGGAEAGAAYLVSGTTRGLVSLSTATTRLLGEEAGDFAGTSVAAAGDLDGDGLADVLVGAPYRSESAETAGEAYLVLGGATGTVSLGDAAVRLFGEALGDQAGLAVAGAGDADGDGLPDLLVASPYEDGGARDAGAAYLVLGAGL